MPRKSRYAELEAIITGSVDAVLLRRTEVLAVYEGPPLQADQKSVSVKLFLGADDRTLSGDELSAIQSRLIAAVAQSKFSLRV